MTSCTKLESAELRGAELEGVCFWRADLRRVDFSGAKLKRANLQEADLRSVDFSDTTLKGPDFQEADLRGAHFPGADLKGANFQEALLQKADLSGARFPGADLKGANLQEALFQEADLRGANLQEALLQKADLSGSDLSEANLERANLQKAILTGAKNLTYKQLARVTTLYQAQIDPEIRQKIEQKCPHLLERPVHVKAKPSPPTSPKATIERLRSSPTKKGKAVGRKITASGTTPPLEDGKHLWLAVQDGERIWPKDPEIRVEPSKVLPYEWDVTIYEEGVPRGGKFDLVLYLVETERARTDPRMVTYWQHHRHLSCTS